MLSTAGPVGSPAFKQGLPDVSLHLILLFAGVILFVLALGLFRARRSDAASAASIWKGGRAAARAALLFWWMSLLLLAASMVLRMSPAEPAGRGDSWARP